MTNVESVNLNSVFNRLFAYILTIKRNIGTQQPGFSEVRKTVLDNLEQTAWVIREKGIDPRDYDDARFAVCVWIDEVLLNIPWLHRNEWQRAMLQTELYGSTRGGDEFFERLNQLTPAQNNVREVYYVCLSLGFMGRYCGEAELGMLEQLKRSTLNMLIGDSAGIASFGKRVVFRGAFVANGMNAGMENSTPDDGSKVWFNWMLIGPPVLLVMMMILYSFMLDNMGDNLITRVIGG